MAPSAVPMDGHSYIQPPNPTPGTASATYTNGILSSSSTPTTSSSTYTKDTPSTSRSHSIDGLHSNMPIAIVGMSCRLPGNVSTPEEFWELCSRARSGWSEIPKDRFNHAAFSHPNPDQLGCYNPQGGHFLEEDLGLFDAPFFNLTEKEAIALDPQQRLLLECTYEALENGGFPKQTLAGKDVGVFVGGSFADYELNNVRDTDTAPMYQATGCAASLLANRLSYYFDFTGPSATVDTACSSSLSALHLACQSLRSGESSHAIVGSCHLNVLPDYFITMSMSGLFSNEGRSFSFDERGSGFGRGEGAGCVVLKPLDQAIKDNDSIRALIVGSGMNQDGRTKGITMPSGDAQKSLIKSVYERAGLDPSETGFIEAHGTGTKIGDPIEASALYDCFGKGRTSRQPLYVGSVKSNIGHLEGASGIVSVIKSAMMLEKGFILPNHDFKTPNPKIPFTEWNMKVPTTQRPWPRGKRYVSVNNFGFGGTNAHTVLERAPHIPKTSPYSQSQNQLPDRKMLYAISANDKASLANQMQNLTVYLEQRPEVFQNSLLKNLAYTLGQRRSVLSWKLAIPARSSSELIPTLVASTIAPSRAVNEPRIGFIFTGQGAQWHAMGKELMDAYPIFSSTMRKIDQCLAKLGATFSLIEELSKDATASRVSEPQISQPSCTAIQIALTDLLLSWGIRPTAVTGHSSGEIASAYAAGIMSLESCVSIAYHRGQSVLVLKDKYPDLDGTMLAIGGSPEDIQPMTKLLRAGRAGIACINSPASVTASGDRVAIEELQELVEEKRIFNRKLRVDVAYHSHHMYLVAEDYRESITNVAPKTTSTAVFHSSLFGRPAEASELTPAYWVDNLTCPVRFSEAIQSMLKPIEKGSTIPGLDSLIEIGPHSALEGPLKQTLKFIGGTALKTSYAATLIRNKNAVDTTLDLAASMFMKGVNLDFEAINFPVAPERAPIVLTDLPRYSWNHSTRYWHKSRISEKHCNGEFPRNDIVGTLANYSNDLEPTWRNIIRADDMPWLRDHKMQSITVYPMSGYITMALEAASQRATLRDIAFDKFELREITVSRPLVISEGSIIETNITFRSHAEGTRVSSDLWDEFRIFSWTTDRGWTEHCRGLISVVKSEGSNVVNSESLREITKNALKARMNVVAVESTVPVESTAMYENLSNIGAGYGPMFQGLEKCSGSGSHATADLVIPNTASVMPMEYESDFIIHPATLDMFIQIVWPILGAGRTDLDVLYMPSFLKKMSISTGITRKSGDRLRIYGSGAPTPANPSPTKLSLFATSIDGKAESLISMEDLVMTPMLGGAESADAIPIRDLCYKMEWESVCSETNVPTDDRLSEVPFPDLDIAIICNEFTQVSLVSNLKKQLIEFTGKMPSVGSLGDIDTTGKISLFLLELEQPFLANLDALDFSILQKTIMSSKGIIWPVRSAYTESQSPNSNMIIGMARSIRSETLLKFVTLDISPESANESAAKSTFEVLKLAFHSNLPDMEYQERDGKLMVPRVVNDTTMNDFVHQKTNKSSAPILQPFNQLDRPLKMAIRTPGALDSLYFLDDTAAGNSIPENEVEIEVKATSMNFKDIMIASGQLQSKCIGVECSGIISRIGSKVTHLAVGDRVAAMSEGAYSTYTRCLGTSAQKVPHAMTFEDAATIPVIYCTAYYSLFDLARLEKGEKVLIHAAAGGVGQAAILLAQIIGAEIFATVGSVAKKEYLMKEYNLPEDHIFYSRDTSFAQAIKYATNGEGVDVILNSLAGNALRETWSCLAHFGRFIEIGKRDITSNSRLEMSIFEHNAMFASVDLTVVAAERPKIMKRLLADVFDLMAKKSIRPVSPITIFSISDVESAFRTLQAGKTMGKIVVVSGENDQVMAIPSKILKNILQPDATYIIIGGTGGVGISMCNWMITRGARHIVLLSRSGKTSDKISSLIDEAKCSDAEVIVRPCDVSSREKVDNLINVSLFNMPPIRGIIHAAMVLDDVLFETMTPIQWTAVISAKVHGAWNFHHALSPSTHSLDFFTVLSSIAGTVGNRGQAAYAAANTFLNAFIQYRLALGLPGSSIDLTAVTDIGYLAENAEKHAQVAENLGGGGISEKEVLALLEASIVGKMNRNGSCGGHCITGLELTPTQNIDNNFWIHDAKFSRLLSAFQSSSSSTGTSSQAASHKNIPLLTLLHHSPSFLAAKKVLADALMDKISSVLMIPREEMEEGKSVTGYGLDSLVAIEIRNWITRECGVGLQVLELLTSGCLGGLAELVLRRCKVGMWGEEEG
ncbi:polyketide synthase [Sclerotinia borealis F-4128]|uniref:Polyketide synthase n=1 Tax=Sclerotinia borealis (strain F-4128) TaxID=1432307 RepID=W9CHU6_SCLBF|nr:polyketide synthase [Sclerotinia borealis F-4128]